MAETALAERLYLLAQQLLPGLAADSGHDYWQACCTELPEARWSKLTVHPGDLGLTAAGASRPRDSWESRYRNSPYVVGVSPAPVPPR